MIFVDVTMSQTLPPIAPIHPVQEKRKGLIMRNEGSVDRLVRVIVGLVLLALVFVGPKTPLGWIGIVPLLTGVIGFCPAYRIFGISTCSARR